MTYKTKDFQEKNPKSGDLNSKLIIQKWAMGNVLNYSEEKFIQILTLKEKQGLIKKINILVEKDIERLISRDKDEYPRFFRTPSRIIGDIWDSDESNELLNDFLFVKQTSITEAYQMTLKLMMKKAEMEIKKKHKMQIFELVAEKTKLLSRRMQSNVQRVLLERFQQSIKKNFILVINRFIPEVFFKPSIYLKGIVYRDTYMQDVFNHFAIHFQYPIVLSQIALTDEQEVLINVAEQEVYVHPDKTLIEKYKKTVKRQLIGGYGKNYTSYEEYTHCAMISNYRDAKLANVHPLFSHSLLYNTEPSIVAKGAPLTYDEWHERIEYIFKTYKGREIMIRIPAFDQYMSIQEIDYKTTIDKILLLHPELYEPLMRAVSDAFAVHVKQKLTIIVPKLMYKDDYETWIVHVKSMLEPSEHVDKVDVVFEFGNHRSMYEIEELRDTDVFVVNIDSLATEYVPEYRFGHTDLNYKKICDSNVHADIQYLKVASRTYPDYKSNVSISGFHLQEESIYRRYVNICHPSFIIPVQSNGHIIDIINAKLARKGKFEGVYERDRDRVLFYREVKARDKKSNLKKRPYGLYDKVRKLQKKNKENKDKDKDPNNEE